MLVPDKPCFSWKKNVLIIVIFFHDSLDAAPCPPISLIQPDAGDNMDNDDEFPEQQSGGHQAAVISNL